MSVKLMAVVVLLLLFMPPATSWAQGGLGGDFIIAMKESAEAKKVRLEWISKERDRINDELKKYDQELEEIEKIAPRSVKPRELAPRLENERKLVEKSFNDWASNNDPSRRFAILRGSGLNVLIRILGPIAHYRQMRPNQDDNNQLFNRPGSFIDDREVNHFRLVQMTSSSPKVIIRLNRLPLDFEWPPVILQNWQAECKDIEKMRDSFVRELAAIFIGPGNKAFLDNADLIDKSLSLLQAKIQKEKKVIAQDRLIETSKRVQAHRDLQESLRYIESVRAMIDRLKKSPSDFKFRHFSGGSTEDFLDFCYTHGMIFAEALPADEEHYVRLFRRMQDYAHDVQIVEDLRNNIEQRIRELNEVDRELVWRASEQ